jgi:hypothetical protein
LQPIFPRFRFLSFHTAVVVVKELMFLLKEATALVDDIASRFERGDASEKLIERLIAQTRIVERYVARLGDNVPSHCRMEIAVLLRNVQAAVSKGSNWLARADGPELAQQNLQRRVCRAYGLATQNK